MCDVADEAIQIRGGTDELMKEILGKQLGL
jgi:hypothetical protein